MCKREDGHDLRGGGDVEPLLSGRAIGRPAQANHALAERALVEVKHARPEDALRVDALSVAVLDVIVHHRAQQVVRGRDGVQVTGEVQVDGVHREHLRIATTCGAALDAENGPHRRLANDTEGRLARTAQRLRQPDGCDRLSLAEGGRVDAGHEDHRAALAAATARGARGARGETQTV